MLVGSLALVFREVKLKEARCTGRLPVASGKTLATRRSGLMLGEGGDGEGEGG